MELTRHGGSPGGVATLPALMDSADGGCCVWNELSAEQSAGGFTSPGRRADVFAAHGPTLADRVEHARRGRPRITAANAASFKPESLKGVVDRGLDSEPALWYWQMTGTDWDGETHSYSLATKKHRRLLTDYQQREQQRRSRPEHQQREKQKSREERVVLAPWPADLRQARGPLRPFCLGGSFD